MGEFVIKLCEHTSLVLYLLSQLSNQRQMTQVFEQVKLCRRARFRDILRMTN